MSVVSFCSPSDSRPHLNDGRHIPNTMPDYSIFISHLHRRTSQLSLPETPEQATFISSISYNTLRQETKAWLLDNVELIQKKFPPASHSAPTSVQGRCREKSSIYVGCGGNAYLHWRLSRFFEAERDGEKVEFHRKNAIAAVEVSLSMLPKRFTEGKEIAFYIGSAGSYAG